MSCGTLIERAALRFLVDACKKKKYREVIAPLVIRDVDKLLTIEDNKARKVACMLIGICAPNECAEKLFAEVLRLGGMLSGEHGIGLAKRPFMAQAFTPATLNAMRGIKNLFDPEGILNPGKTLPDSI